MSAHLGRRVSQLLDGQLSADEADAAWAHVHTCHQCRDEVEREGWVKTRLSTLSFGSDCAPEHLKGALLGMPPGDGVLNATHASQVDRHLGGHRDGQHDLANRPRARRIAGIALGGGAVGAAVVGVLALGTAPADMPTIERRQHQQQPAAQVTPGPVAPRVPVRLPR